jgi:hypothetical protein
MLWGCACGRCGETYVLALGDGGEIDFDLGLGEDVGGGGHVDEEVWWASVSLYALHQAGPSYYPQNSQLLCQRFQEPVFSKSHALQSVCKLWRCRVVIPCTVAFAPSADSAPMEPTMKYWNTLGPVSPPLLRYAANEGILVESLEPLKGLSNEEAEALRVCSAVQPALATGNWWAVHERAIARVVWARAGIVDAVRVGGG